MRSGTRVRLARLGRPLARRRRQRARQLQRQGDRELPGRLPHSAGEADARRRAAAGHRRHPRRQLARAAVELGRPQRPAQRARSRRAAAARAARRIRRRHDRGRARGAVGARRDADARQYRGAAGRHLQLRRFPRQRRRDRQAALRIALDLTIAGDRMRLDFSRSAPPCDGPLNIARSTTVACCYVALKHLFTDVPANAGCLAPIEFVIPDTTLLGVSAPRPVGGYTETILRVIDIDLRRLRQGRARARQRRPFATINALSLAGWRAHGRRWVMFCFFGGGLGGNPRRRRAQPRQQSDLDRHHSAGGDSRVALSRDVHAMGAAAGFRRRRAAIAAGSARSTRSRRWPRAAPRSFSWASAASIRRSASTAARPRRSIASSTRPDSGEATPPLVSKVTDVKIRRGQRVRLETPGGGGFGDPAAREPGARRARRPPRLRLAPTRRARDYKVVLRDDLSLDADATAAARGRTSA